MSFDTIDRQHRQRSNLVQYECVICGSPDDVAVAFPYGLGDLSWYVRLCGKCRVDAELRRPK